MVRPQQNLEIVAAIAPRPDNSQLAEVADRAIRVIDERMGENEIELDLNGKVVQISRDVVSAIAASAAANAGISGRHRDLSILLGRALESGRATLQRGEVRALCAVLEEDQCARFGPGVAELLRAVA
jgi:hypothetical protein